MAVQQAGSLCWCELHGGGHVSLCTRWCPSVCLYGVCRVSVRFLHAPWNGAVPAVKMGHPGQRRLGQGEQGAELRDLEAFPRAVAQGGILSSSRGSGEPLCHLLCPCAPCKASRRSPQHHWFHGLLFCLAVGLLVALEMHQMGRSLFPMSLDLSRLKTHPKT